MPKVITSRFDGTPASQAAARSLLEALRPRFGYPERCEVCEGSGEVRDDKALPTYRCEACSGSGWAPGAANVPLPAHDANYLIDLSAIPAAERPALAAILQAAVDRPARPMAAEDEEAVLRELLRQHMRGLIGDAVKAGA